MIIKNSKEIEKLREDYPIGTIIELVRMDDKQSPPQGTKGTVNHIDDLGDIHISWDNGSSLALIPDIDDFIVIQKPLNYFTCLRLLDCCVNASILQNNPKNKNEILVCMTADDNNPEGWYIQNIMSCATELAGNVKGQNTLIEALKDKGIEFTEKPEW